MVLPQIDSGAKVGRTCGKALSRKELKEAQALYLGWPIVHKRFILWFQKLSHDSQN
jgi:hypothetical protein